MNQTLQNILELQTALSGLHEAEQRLHGIPDWMRELHDEHEKRKAEIQALEASAEETAKQRRTAEGAVQDAQEKLKKYQQQINKVSTQREYGALLQEIDTVKGQITSQEEQAFSSLERHEQAQKDLAALRESFREIEERYAAEQTRWEAEKPGIAHQVADFKTRIADLKAKLPRPLVSQFERILDRYPTGAVAPVRPIERPGQKQREWHCVACNYRVRPQVVVEIRNGNSLVQCESCKRILFFEEEQA
ncbi:MAG TPA: C4-type zinc ribbon domain-containing protein [Thermoanaerobaculia bacterium]|jgi:predicted  nucleic acid-binding Zn-ribbon protein|nr:C4-type zinc ribbon domain-containing protein [Thermoanaerobaculia bacterium]